jgi:hypothetical protein
MSRFTTDVIASCAFGIDSNSLKNPDAEFSRYLRDLFKMRGLKIIGSILAFFAPHLMKIFRIQIVDNKVADFVRNLVWSTVEYRSVLGNLQWYCRRQVSADINMASDITGHWLMLIFDSGKTFGFDCEIVLWLFNNAVSISETQRTYTCTTERTSRVVSTPILYSFLMGFLSMSVPILLPQDPF